MQFPLASMFVALFVISIMSKVFGTTKILWSTKVCEITICSRDGGGYVPGEKTLIYRHFFLFLNFDTRHFSLKIKCLELKAIFLDSGLHVRGR